MFQWDNEYKWDFPLAGTSDDEGANNSTIKEFRQAAYSKLVKEALQNSLDARVDPKKPVKVIFEKQTIDSSDVPGASQIYESICESCEYFPDGKNHEPIEQEKKYAKKYFVEEHRIPVLKISDYNTTGLTGVNDLENRKTHWYGLVKSFNQSNKGDGENGSQGVGKFSHFAYSTIQTVLYGTYTNDNYFGFQGKIILTTHYHNRKKYLSKARFGELNDDKTDVKPITDPNKVPIIFRRGQNPGTDVYILGFETEDHDWKKEIALSVLENFFYAISENNIEIEIREDNQPQILINKFNLEKELQLAAQYFKVHEENLEPFKFTANEYWEVVKEGKCVEKDFKYKWKSYGKYKLYLSLNDSQEKRKGILLMRQGGMKIREKTDFRIPLNFKGLFIATGIGAKSDAPEDNISSFLRRCEDATHENWEAENYEGHEKEAKSFLQRLWRTITENINELMPKSETLEEFGTKSNKFLRIRVNNGVTDEASFIQNKPEKIRLVPIENNESGRIGTKLKKKKNFPKIIKPGSSNPGSTNPNTRPIKSKKIPVKRVDFVIDRCIYFQCNKTYRVILLTEENFEDLEVKFQIITDNGNNVYANISSASSNGIALKISENTVFIPKLIAKETFIFNIQIQNTQALRMVAEANGKLIK